MNSPNNFNFQDFRQIQGVLNKTNNIAYKGNIPPISLPQELNNNIFQNIQELEGKAETNNFYDITNNNKYLLSDRPKKNNINEFSSPKVMQRTNTDRTAFFRPIPVSPDSIHKKTISFGTNTFSRNFLSSTERNYQKETYFSNINLNYPKFGRNPQIQTPKYNNHHKSNKDKRFFDEDFIRGRPDYYEFKPSELICRKLKIEKPYIELKEKILKDFKKIKENQTFDKYQEYVVNYGYFTEEILKEEKKKNPENFIDIKDAIKQKDSNEKLFILGKLGESLENMGIEVAIDKRENIDNDEYIINNHFISSGLIRKNKYEIHINEKDEMKKYRILNDINEQKKFIEEWKEIISKEIEIPKEEIFITNVREGSLKMDLIFKKEIFKDINGIKININERMKNFANCMQYPQIISIFEKNILGSCKLTINMLDKRGDRSPVDWPNIGKRGGEDYFPPDKNWVGYGLKVLDEYDNNDWIAMDGNPNEWAVAYHGTSEKAIKPICQKSGKFFSTIQEGATGQKCEDYENINPKSKNDYPKCGEGTYCSPHLDYANKYFRGVIIMCRVNPNLIRIPKGQYEKDEWITDGTRKSIRPYRLLYKLN